MKLLVVENHVETASVLSRLLRMDGHTADVAHNSRSALELCEHNSYDMVLADITLPDGTGWELMETLQRRCSMRGIAISSFGQDSDVRQSLESGFSEHLVKPILMDCLTAAIERVAALPPRTLPHTFPFQNDHRVVAP